MLVCMHGKKATGGKSIMNKGGMPRNSNNPYQLSPAQGKFDTHFDSLYFTCTIHMQNMFLLYLDLWLLNKSFVTLSTQYLPIQESTSCFNCVHRLLIKQTTRVQMPIYCVCTNITKHYFLKTY